MKEITFALIPRKIPSYRPSMVLVAKPPVPTEVSISYFNY